MIRPGLSSLLWQLTVGLDERGTHFYYDNPQCHLIMTIHPSIHPFSIPTLIRRLGGGGSSGERYTLDRSPVHHRATQRQTRQTCSHSLLRTSFQRHQLPVFVVWKEVGEPRENPRIHGENSKETPQKGPSRDLNLEPSCCEVTVLTTTPPCSPHHCEMCLKPVVNGQHICDMLGAPNHEKLNVLPITMDIFQP